MSSPCDRPTRTDVRQVTKPTASQPSACEWLSRLGRRELSARELAIHYLERIETANPQLNAMTALDHDRTLADADLADKARAASDNRPLLGLPVTIKDSIEVEGFPCTGGSVARKDHRPTKDATVVERLRAAGAIVLGKSNVPEYIASFETDNVLYGRTNNPFDLTRTPGGSSGGEGAVLGADASPAGLGSDGGGSIRVPCHYCGIVGLRPTVGVVPETGAWPSSRGAGLLDIHTIGPMARYVEDMALLLNVIAGPDGQDPYAVPVPLGEWREIDVTNLRIGVYTADPLTKPTQETEAAVSRAALALESLGSIISYATPPTCVSEATRLFFASSGADGGARMRDEVMAACGQHHPQFETLLSFGADQPPPTASSFFTTLRTVQRFRAELRTYISEFDAVLCPVVAGPAPPHGVPPADVPQGAYFRYEAFNYTHTYSLAGLPAAVVPVGVDPHGLPIGAQIVAGPFRDHVAIAVAAALERDFPLFAEGERPTLAESPKAPTSPDDGQ